MASILILGGGFGGLAAAHELRPRLPDNHKVSVVAADDHFYTGFAKLWDLVGTRPLEQGTASLSTLERHGIHFIQTHVTAIDPSERRVETEAGSFSADFLLVALGAGPGPERFLQLQGPAHDLYDANELPQMRADLAAGTLVVAILGAPYKCPPAPYEAAFLLDEHLRGRGVRDAIELVVTTPQPMTLPAAGSDISQFVADALKDRDIELRTERACRLSTSAPAPCRSPMVGSFNTHCCWLCPRLSHRKSSPTAPWLAKEAGSSPTARPFSPASRGSTRQGIARRLPRRKPESSPKLRPASPHATSRQKSPVVPAIGSTARATASLSSPANAPQPWRAISSPSHLRYGRRSRTPRRSSGSRLSRPSGSVTGSMSASAELLERIDP